MVVMYSSLKYLSLKQGDYHIVGSFPYFIEYSAHVSLVCTFYLNDLFMNKVGECYLPSIVCRPGTTSSFSMKKGCTILDKIR
jgi:hypothetical protein